MSPLTRHPQGSFGQVIRALDKERSIDVAIKIIKSKKPFLAQAQTEIDILTRLREHDPTNTRHLGKGVAGPLLRLLILLLAGVTQCA